MRICEHGAYATYCVICGDEGYRIMKPPKDYKFMVAPIAVFGCFELRIKDGNTYPITLDEMEELHKSLETYLELHGRIDFNDVLKPEVNP